MTKLQIKALICSNYFNSPRFNEKQTNVALALKKAAS